MVATNTSMACQPDACAANFQDCPGWNAECRTASVNPPWWSCLYAMGGNGKMEKSLLATLQDPSIENSVGYTQKELNAMIDGSGRNPFEIRKQRR